MPKVSQRKSVVWTGGPKEVLSVPAISLNWRYVWHEDTDGPNEFRFECVECLYKHIFTHYGVIDRFGPMFCHADVINYGNLPYTDFIRTQTLCQGGDKCDFCFIRHAKGEDWERTKSI